MCHFPYFSKHITPVIQQEFKKFHVLILILFHQESSTLFGPIFRRMTHMCVKNKRRDVVQSHPATRKPKECIERNLVTYYPDIRFRNVSFDGHSSVCYGILSTDGNSQCLITCTGEPPSLSSSSTAFRAAVPFSSAVDLEPCQPQQHVCFT